MAGSRPRTTATAFGIGAILLWATLAALTSAVGPVPPFQLSAMTFALGAVVGLLWTRLVEGSVRPAFAIDRRALLLGIYGLLLFHTCYFFALQRAPAIEASLIIYLWPLLIVIFSGFLPASAGGGALNWRHLAGAGLGLTGTAIIIFSGTTQSGATRNLDGYIAAALAALIWASYSVMSRMLASVPTATVASSCLATAFGAAILHILVETTVWPATASAWLAVIALGLGPVGLAFYLWDEGMKHGDIRFLGVASYATPLLSTLLLASLGTSAMTPAIGMAAILISIGAYIAGSASKR